MNSAANAAQETQPCAPGPHKPPAVAKPMAGTLEMRDDIRWPRAMFAA
ncbi:hypothetical protein [Rhizobium sp. Leaf262]|nr:hypothetical protein [Rhizobium sp. Leaf262]